MPFRILLFFLVCNFELMAQNPSTADSLLLYALKEGTPDQVKKALAQGARPDIRDSRGMQPAQLAVLRGDPAILQEIQLGGVDLQQNYKPSLYAMAVGVGNPKIIQLLDHAGLRPQSGEKCGSYSLLMYTAVKGRFDLFSHLVKKGLDPMLKDSLGNSPLLLSQQNMDTCPSLSNFASRTATWSRPIS